MRKKILLILGCIFTIYSYGQTVLIGDYLANPGPINIPVEVTDFASSDVAAISIFFEYDPTVVTFTGYTGVALAGMQANALYENGIHQIGITWSASGSTGVNIPDGDLITLNFNYLTGNGDFAFMENKCDVVDNNYISIPVLYVDGSVGPQLFASVSIAEVTGVPNTPVNVPINVDFSTITSGVSSFSFVIDFDETVLQYQNISNPQLSNILVDIISDSRIALTWLNEGTSGSTLNGELLSMGFTFVGGYSDLTFDTDLCSIGDNDGLDVVGSYTNGWVTQDPASIVQVIAGTIEDATAGTTVEVPITVQNFSNIGSFNFYILFDQTALSFVDIVNIDGGINSTDLISNVVDGNKLVILWDNVTSALTLADDTKLFDMQFSFSGNASDLSFVTGECEISDFQVNTLYGEYTDGLVSESPLAIDVQAAEVIAQPGDVLMPITAGSFENIGAFDFVISFDPNIATFNALTNELASLDDIGVLMTNLSGDQIFISWSIDPEEVSGLTVADGDKLFDLDFTYLGGETTVDFVQESCAVSDFDLDLLDVVYQSGNIRGGIQVQLTLFLEGLYNTTTDQMNKAQTFNSEKGETENMYGGLIADLIDVEIHSATNYGTLIYTAEDVELMQDGTASFEIPAEYNDEYSITIKHRNHLETVNAAPVSFKTPEVIYDFTTAATQAYGSNMKELESGVFGLYGGDVNQDGYINVSDREMVQTKVLEIAKGYVSEDVNGDGYINVSDREIVQSSVLNIIQKQIP